MNEHSGNTTHSEKKPQACASPELNWFGRPFGNQNVMGTWSNRVEMPKTKFPLLLRTPLGVSGQQINVIAFWWNSILLDGGRSITMRCGDYFPPSEKPQNLTESTAAAI